MRHSSLVGRCRYGAVDDNDRIVFRRQRLTFFSSSFLYLSKNELHEEEPGAVCACLKRHNERGFDSFFHRSQRVWHVFTAYPLCT